MKVLFDTNVLADVLLARAPHLQASAYLWDQVNAGAAAIATRNTDDDQAATRSRYRPPEIIRVLREADAGFP